MKKILWIAIASDIDIENNKNLNIDKKIIDPNNIDKIAGENNSVYWRK